MKGVNHLIVNNLKFPLQEWAVENEPSKNMIFYQGYWEQILFVRDIIPRVILSNLSFEEARNCLKVISTHTSKSIKLPVYEITIPEHNITIILRYNFYDWKISVVSEKDIELDFMSLFDEEEEIAHLYCEGFPRELVFSSYSHNKKQFTFEVRGKYKLHTFLWLLKHYLEN